MKKLKGDYSALVTYEVGDVVRYSNGNVYHLQRPAKAGVPPTETLYWGSVEQKLAEAIIMVLDGIDISEAAIPSLANNLTTTAAGKALDARQGKALKTLIDGTDEDVSDLQAVIPNKKSIILASSVAESTDTFAITVDESGETPALAVTKIVAEAAEDTPAAEGGE